MEHDNMLMGKKLPVVLLFMLVGLALVLRLVHLQEGPYALHRDEAVNGYNALSYATTGCDYQGACNTALTSAFGSVYSGSLYPLITAPLVSLFGLNELAVRLPALIGNTLLLFVLYWLTFFMTNNRWAALLVVFWMVFNPWHFHFSRLAHEASLGPLLYFLAVFLLVRGFYGKPLLIIMAGLVLGISAYGYQIARLIAPTIMLVGPLIYFSRVRKNWPYWVGAIIVMLVVIFPLVWQYARFDPGGERLREKQVLIVYAEDKLFQLAQNVRVTMNYDFMFRSGEIRHVFDHGYPSAAGVGVFQNYLWVVAVLLLPGLIYFVISGQENKKHVAMLVFLLLLWLAVPLLTIPAPHRARAYSFFPVIYILLAMGLYGLIKSGKYVVARIGLSNKIIFIGLFLLIALLLTLEAWHAKRFVKSYFAISPAIYTAHYQVGLKEVMLEVKARQQDFDRVYLTGSGEHPFIYLLFYMVYPPSTFQGDVKVWDKESFGYMYSFNKYFFVQDEEMNQLTGDYLYVAKTDGLKKKLLKTVQTPYGGDKYYLYVD